MTSPIIPNALSLFMPENNRLELLVRYLAQQFELTVTEGRVELANIFSGAKLTSTTTNSLMNTIPAAKKRFLDAGESIIYQNMITKSMHISPDEIMQKSTWQEGLLDFADVTRYTATNIKIVDAELRDLKFGGLFRISELDSLFDALESNFNLVIEHDADGTILLKRKSS